MKRILQINTGLNGQASQSTKLASEMSAKLKARFDGSDVLVRDLSETPVPHLTAATFGAFITAADERTSEQQEAVAYSDKLIKELADADTVVLGLPMYNFNVPSTLKAYFDQLARAGVTFKYTENGPVGLLEDKPVYVMAARGGKYAGTPADFQTGYVRQFFNFLGIKSVEFVYAEGLAMGGEAAETALGDADASMTALVAA